ncbi:hypothetical protein AGMMS49546_37710 [Spirochaetia bacterium]|nr:hypothetical protein AGMMS49546_37710 [Spirochaetia bacterium]
MIRIPPVLFLCPLLIVLSCAYKEEVNFPVRGMDQVLYGTSKAASAGILNTAKPKKLEYRFEPPLSIPPLCSLELEYGFAAKAAEHTRNEIKKNYQPALHIGGGDSWALPWDASFLNVLEEGEVKESGPQYSFHYAVPLSVDRIESFSIEMIPAAPDVKGKAPQLNWELRELRLVTQWYGIVRNDPDYGGSGAIHATPFVYSLNGTGRLGIDPPSRFRFAGGSDLSIIRPVPAGKGRSSGGIAAELGRRRFETRAGGEELFIHRGNFPAAPYPITVEIPGIGESLADDSAAAAGEAPAFTISLLPAAELAFPNPVPADPGLILAYPQENWRNRDYEVFRWESFPSLLIFDTADYAVQDRLLKRLAFFTEKAGFRGRLASDAEIADQHGWNAHDYRSEDLARFFDLARATHFPLLQEERELEGILLDAGIIRRSGSSIVSGEGGIISISRESPDYLRILFMVHEGFHGLFFIDADFREWSRRRWEKFDPAIKRFILSYFDYQHYDIKDEYLVINEFMAHCLQQSASRAPRYFGETLASRIDASPWRRTVLPKKDEASGSWPAIADAFRLEAAAFSDYVNRRWGLAAGRVWQISVSDE